MVGNDDGEERNSSRVRYWADVMVMGHGCRLQLVCRRIAGLSQESPNVGFGGRYKLLLVLIPPLVEYNF